MGFVQLYAAYPVLYYMQPKPYINSFRLNPVPVISGDTNSVAIADYSGISGNPNNVFKMLEIKNLQVEIDGKEILRGFSLTVPKGEVHAIMGPNGSGKSTLSKVIAGHEGYVVTGGKVTIGGRDISEMSVDERSRAGIFLAFQYPAEVPGVSNANFIRAALQARLPKGEEIDAIAASLALDLPVPTPITAPVKLAGRSASVEPR